MVAFPLEQLRELRGVRWRTIRFRLPRLTTARRPPRPRSLASGAKLALSLSTASLCGQGLPVSYRFPFVDAVAVGGLQIELLRRLSHLYDVPFSENSGKALIASLAGTMIPTTSGIGAASMLKSVPVIGTITAAFVMPVLSSGATFAIGRAFIQHFESGGTLLDFNPPDYREFLRNQKELWDLRRKKNLPAETTATPPEGQTPGGATTA